VIKWFWEVLKESSESEKADFLMFATGKENVFYGLGSPLVPFGGFKNLKGAHGVKKFTIAKD
jgi:E3 ubiquitin-protein ligase HUWE1